MDKDLIVIAAGVPLILWLLWKAFRRPPSSHDNGDPLESGPGPD